MSDPITTPDNHTNENTKKPRRSWAKLGIWLCFLGLLILLSAFGYGYVELAKVNMTLANQLDHVEKMAQSTEKNVSSLQTDVQTLQKDTEKAEALSAKQEQLMSEWEAAQKGSMVKWQAAEAKYLIRLAQDELNITHNPVTTLTLLQRAEEVLKNSDDQTILPIRQSLAANITQLQAAAPVDVTSLYIRINSLMELITQLPFPATPLAENSTATSADTSKMTWWKAGLTHTWESLRKIVIVRYDETHALPLIAPEEKIYLYQNLQAQLENVLWAVLNRNDAVYQASLARADAWVKKYFDQNAAVTKNMLQSLQELQGMSLKVPTVNLAETLKLFGD